MVSYHTITRRQNPDDHDLKHTNDLTVLFQKFLVAQLVNKFPDFPEPEDLLP